MGGQTGKRGKDEKGGGEEGDGEEEVGREFSSATLKNDWL